MSKSISINPNPRNKQHEDKALDAFVTGVSSQAQPKERMKRLTFDISADLHKRIKRACLERDEEMAVALRRILSDQFPSTAP